MRKILAKISGTLTDVTGTLSSYDNGRSVTIGLGTDVIYVGSWLPFNSLYLNVATANTTASTLKVSVWCDSQWREVEYILDNSNCLFYNDSFLIVPNEDYSWQSEDTEEITELSSVNIRDMYWMKIETNDVIDSLSFKYIGNLFSTDNDLFSEYEELNRTAVKSAISSGKTNYIQQGIRAAEIIAADMRQQKRIFEVGQIVDAEALKLPSVSKTAEIVYGMLGDDYADKKLAAHKEYRSRMESCFPVIDKNADGVASKSEASTTAGSIFI